MGGPHGSECRRAADRRQSALRRDRSWRCDAQTRRTRPASMSRMPAGWTGSKRVETPLRRRQLRAHFVILLGPVPMRIFPALQGRGVRGGCMVSFAQDRRGANSRESPVSQAMLARLGPPLAILLLAGPIQAGLLGRVCLPFGYLPALGGHSFTTQRRYAH